MATEDFNSYTEVDPSTHITITAAKVAWAAVNRNETSYVYDDKGSAHFDGDFTHLFEINPTDCSGTVIGYNWALANAIEDRANSNDVLGFYTYNGSGDLLYLIEKSGAAGYSDTYSFTCSTVYYIEVERDESVGTYGTLYGRIYSDSARTTLLDTLLITLHDSKKDFQYIYGFCSNNDGGTTGTSTNYTKDLDLQEAAGTTYYRTNTGSITPTGALTKKVSKGLAGSITVVGALVKTTQKALAGSVTPSGALSTIVLFTQAVTGSITPSGALVKTTQKALAGDLTLVGALVKKTSRTLTGSLTPVGTLAKKTQRLLAGSTTPSGALATVFTATITLVGSIIPSGIVTTVLGLADAGVAFLQPIYYKIIRKIYRKSINERKH